MVINKAGYIITSLSSVSTQREKRDFLHSLIGRRRHLFSPLSYLWKKEIMKRKWRHLLASTPYNPYLELEQMQENVSKELQAPLYLHHLYLDRTLEEIDSSPCEKLFVLPLWPHFSYFYAGKVARDFEKKLSQKTVRKLVWIKSFSHASYWLEMWKKCLEKEVVEPEKTILLFSLAAPPLITEHDPYLSECYESCRLLLHSFPSVLGKVGFQGAFFEENALSPSTIELCHNIELWAERRKNILLVPLSLIYNDCQSCFELEKIFLPLLQKKGYNVSLCKPHCMHFSSLLPKLFSAPFYVTNQMLCS